MKKAVILSLLPILSFGQSLLVEANHFFNSKQYAKAEQTLVKYLEVSPDDLVAIELMGDAVGHQRKWDEAISHYKALVKAKPDNANYQYKFGGAMGMKALSVSKLRALPLIGDIKSAFLKAAKLDPEHIDTRWALVELYVQLPGVIGGSYKKAHRYADELMALSPIDGHLSKGYVYEYEKEPKDAEFHYKKAVELGGSITCYEKLTDFYANQQEHDKAITNMQKAYEKHNVNALHYQIGKVSADYNIQLEKGERCLKRFIENHSARDGVPLEMAYYRLAQIKKHQKDKAEALKCIDKALSIRANFKQAIKEKARIQAL